MPYLFNKINSSITIQRIMLFYLRLHIVFASTTTSLTGASYMFTPSLHSPTNKPLNSSSKVFSRSIYELRIILHTDICHTLYKLFSMNSNLTHHPTHLYNLHV